MNIHVLRFIAVGFVWLFAMPVHANTLRLLEQQGLRAPNQAFLLLLEKPIAGDRQKTWTFELDAIDVTAWVKWGSYRIHLNPPKKLSPGKHNLRIVVESEDGEFEELAFWEFEVGNHFAIEQSNTDAQFGLIAGQSFATKPRKDDQTFEGNMSVQSELKGRRWAANWESILTYSHALEAQGLPGYSGQFRLGWSTKNLNATLGEQIMPYNQLIMTNFSRRGLSATLSLPRQNQLSVFSLRSRPIEGLRHGLGISDSDNLISGLTWGAPAIGRHPNWLQVRATYLRGKSNQLADASVGFSEDEDNEVMALSTQSRFFRNRIYLNTELAASSGSLQHENLAVDLDDNAYKLQLIYTATTARYPWHTGFESVRVGHFFRSMANPLLPKGKQMNRLFSAVQIKRWQFNGSAGFESSLDTETQLLDESAFIGNLTVNYNHIAPPKHPLWSRVGTPSATMMFNVNDRDQTVQLIPGVREMLTQSTNMAGFQVMFARDTMQWSLGSQFSRLKTPASNVSVYNHTFNLSQPLGEKVTLTPSLQLNTTDDGSNVQKNRLYNLDIAFSELMKRLNGTINSNRSEGSGNQQTTTTGELTWQWIKPRTNRPGFNIGLSWQYLSAKTVTTTVEQRFVLSLIMTLPLQYGINR